MHRTPVNTGSGDDRLKRVKRRAYLQTIAATGIAGLAGCIAGNSVTSPTPDGETNSPTPSETSTSSAAPNSIATPGNPCAEPLSSPPTRNGSPDGGGSIAWKRAFPASIGSITPLDGGRLLVTTGTGTLAALTRETGDIAWEADLGDSVGPPLIEGDTIVARVVTNVDGHDSRTVTLHGLAADTGEERWTALTTGYGYAGGFHLIEITEDFVLVREAYDVIPNVQPMHAVSLTDGTTRWTADVGSHRGTHVCDGTIYYAGDNGVTAFEFDGSRRWEWSHDISPYDALGGTALVCGHVVVHGPDDGVIHGVGIESGESQWTFDPSNTYGRLYGYRGRLFVADENQTRLNPTNGEPVWTRTEHRDHMAAGYGLLFGANYGDSTITARAISDGTISWEQQMASGARLAGVAHGQLFIIRSGEDSLDGSSYLEALNAATGENLWTRDAEHGFDWHSAMIGAERVYVTDQPEQGSSQGTLLAVRGLT